MEWWIGTLALEKIDLALKKINSSVYVFCISVYDNLIINDRKVK